MDPLHIFKSYQRLLLNGIMVQNMCRDLNEQEAKCNLLESETPTRLSKLETRLNGLDDTIHQLDSISIGEVHQESSLPYARASIREPCQKPWAER